MSSIDDAWRLMAEIFAYRADTSQDDDCPNGEPTATPGLFYHGSPATNLSNLRQADAEGIFLTENPNYAAVMGSKNRVCGGRIYRARLVTRNPLYLDGGAVLSREEKRAVCNQARSEGHDAVVSVHLGGTIHEIVALNDDVVRLLDHNAGPMKATGGCIYCDQSAWPKMDFAILRAAEIDCLVDPRDGSALMLDSVKIVPFNRAQRRALRSRSR